MPTGYTRYIEDGSIEKASEFLMLCSRAFGALIYMRDEPLNKPIPKEFEADDYYQRTLNEEKVKLFEYRSMSLSDAQKQINFKHEEKIKSAKKAKDKAEQLRSKYLRILRDVKSWIPPTPEHEGIKKFAIEQIEMCIPDMSIYESEINKVKPDADEWLKIITQNCEENIKRYAKETQKENERTASRNRWLKDLRESLEGNNE